MRLQSFRRCRSTSNHCWCEATSRSLHFYCSSQNNTAQTMYNLRIMNIHWVCSNVRQMTWRMICGPLTGRAHAALCGPLCILIIYYNVVVPRRTCNYINSTIHVWLQRYNRVQARCRRRTMKYNETSTRGKIFNLPKKRKWWSALPSLTRRFRV